MTYADGSPRRHPAPEPCTNCGHPGLFDFDDPEAPEAHGDDGCAVPFCWCKRTAGDFDE